MAGHGKQKKINDYQKKAQLLFCIQFEIGIV